MRKQVYQHGEGSLYVENNFGQIVFGAGRLIPKALTTLPAVSNLLFLGRESKVKEIAKALRQAKGKQIIQLNGFGGMGKTTVAEHYLDQHQGKYAHICYVKCQGNIQRTFADHTQLIDNLLLNHDVKGKGTKAKFELVIGRLRQLHGKCLLIVDNATPDLVYSENFDALMLTPDWDVLITAREVLTNCQPIEIGQLDPQAAEDLFYAYYHLEEDRSLSARLLELVEYHTLTIEVIAKTSEIRIFKLAEILDIVKKKPQTFREGNQLELRLGEADSGILTATESFYLKFSD